MAARFVAAHLVPGLRRDDDRERAGMTGERRPG
jgi:hypothetical protein